MVTSLTEAQATLLQAADYTYPDVGATAAATLPPGYHRLSRSRALSDSNFQEAGEQLVTWQLHERSGLRVASSSPRAQQGVVVLMRLGLGPASLRIPCRVVYTVQEPDRVGFAYGTLPGHPESGEELFVLERDHQDGVRLTVSAFSRPASKLARLGGPVSRRVQDLMTDRYLHALDHS